MKNGLIRALIFLLAFQIEVRVRASEEVLEQPAQCLKSTDLCALQVYTDAFHFEKKGVRLHASGNSTLSRQSLTSWKLIHGALWIEKGKSVKVETLYGTVQSPQGAFWVLEEGDRVIVRNISSDLEITLRDGVKLTVPEGFEIWIGGIGPDTKSTFGMIKPVDMKAHLTLWASVYPGSKSEFLTEVQSLKERWGDLAIKSSDIYQGVIDRRIASAEEKQRFAEEKKAKIAAERQRVRELFFHRTFER